MSLNSKLQAGRILQQGHRSNLASRLLRSATIPLTMDYFPEFMKHAANRIATPSQATPEVEGYVFDGADGSQMIFWTCPENAASDEHVHDYDEYMIVVQGCYILIISETHIHETRIKEARIRLTAGEEYFIPRGVPHSGEVVAGTRTIHAFGGHRVDRVGDS
jgi:quercetin dioxygenase-like cupin family protein